ncbi:MAG: AAA family ATPase [Alphaproteobacteria bacterium]|nr:AAA family ATPase [Alphaproteobacteria bacterium]
MSDQDLKGTDTLLPAASISVFSRDQETLNAASAIADDWRFARVHLSAVDGDVVSAISKFSAEGSTDLVIIQTEDINDSFTERLGELSAYCDEDTAAIIIGPVNDVYLYRKLIEMGVSDYLVKPVTSEIFTDVIAKALIERLGVSDSSLIAFIGAKGGVGTSSIAQIAALCAAEKMGQKTMLLDAAGGWSPISVGMGFDPSATLFEVARAVEAKNEDAIKRVMFGASNKLNVLATGSDAMLDASISPAQYENILDNMMAKYPVTLVDLSCSENALKKAVLSRAHQIVVVTEPTVTSLRFSRSLLKEISVVRGGEQEDISLLVNKVGINKAHEVSLGDIQQALEFKPAGAIAFNTNIFMKHESDMDGILNDKEAPPVLSTIMKIIGKTISSGGSEKVSEEAEESGFFSGILGKMKT